MHSESSSDPNDLPTNPERRVWLDRLLKVTVLAWLGTVAYPVLRYLRPMSQQGQSGPVPLTRSEVTKLESERFAIVPVGQKRVLVFEDGEGELHALDARCTHEGCTVRYRPDEALISCACHNARFDLSGRVLSGPPPRPLPRYLARRDGEGGITVDTSVDSSVA